MIRIKMTNIAEKVLSADWYDKKDELWNEVTKHGGFVQAQRAHPEVSETTLRRRWEKFGLPKFEKPRQGVRLATEEELNVRTELENAVLKAIDKLGDYASFADIADAVDVAPKRVREVVDHLTENKGFRFNVNEGEQTHVE